MRECWGRLRSDAREQERREGRDKVAIRLTLLFIRSDKIEIAWRAVRVMDRAVVECGEGGAVLGSGGEVPGDWSWVDVQRCGGM